jgi:gentisate 1,2-dioxygenase
VRYSNPATGGHPFPTMAVFMQWLPKGHAGARYRSTDGTVFCVVEGKGSVEIGETRWPFFLHDIFVAPSWEFYRLRADSDCVLFSYSDRAAQEALGFWREETPG